MTKSLYSISNGEAVEASNGAEWDAIDGVFVYAETPGIAVDLAVYYALGHIQPGNVWISGRAVAALS